MATQAIRQQVVAIPQQEEKGPSRVKEFFSAIVDLAGVYFGKGSSMAQLDSSYRASLLTHERAKIDAVMNGVWTN